MTVGGLLDLITVPKLATSVAKGCFFNTLDGKLVNGQISVKFNFG